MEWVVVGMVRRGCVVVEMVRGMALAGALMEGVGVVGCGFVEVVGLVVVGCVVVVFACGVVVICVVALRWVAGEYSGSGLCGRCRVKCVARDRGRASGSGRGGEDGMGVCVWAV